MAEAIDNLISSGIGEPKKWEKISKKISNYERLTESDIMYFKRMSRIYIEPKKVSRIYHQKLSEEDQKPPCIMCGQNSLFYCGLNDSYFCQTHVIGHDENEYP